MKMLEKNQTKVDEAYVLIEEQLITQELAPGTLLSENDLIKRFGIGRTPVREALQRLAGEGLVEVMPRRGVRVTEIDIKTQLRLIEVRRGLEELQAVSAAKRASQHQRSRFKEIAAEMKSSAKIADYSTFNTLDREFNRLMSEACDNQFVGSILHQLHGLSRRFWHAFAGRKSNLKDAARLHAQVALAVYRGDVREAKKSAAEHMQYVENFTKATLEL